MRRALSTRTRVRVFDTASGICSICGLKIHAGETWDISHETPLALGGDDEEANMRPAHRSCHKAQTAQIDIPQIAKMKRQHASHIGAKRSANPFPGSRDSKWKKTFNHGWVPR